MTKQFLLSAILLLGTSSAGLAADIDGKWTAQVEGRRGSVTQTLVLTASGSSLTGSFDGGRGNAVDISDGMLDGNKVAFKVVREFNGNQFAQQYKGTLSDAGDLKLTVSMSGGGRRGGGGFGGGKSGKNGRGGSRTLVFKKAAS